MHDRLRHILKDRMFLAPNDMINQKRCWQDITRQCSTDIDATIDFLDNYCSPVEFACIVEVAEDIALIIKHPPFIDALIRCAHRYDYITQNTSIISNIRLAIALIFEAKVQQMILDYHNQLNRLQIELKIPEHFCNFPK